MARAGCTLTFESVRVGAPTPTSTSTSPRQGDRLVLLPPVATWSTTALPGDALTTSASPGAPLDSVGRVRGPGRPRRGVWGTACVAVAALVALFVGVPVAVAIWDASRAA